MLRLFVLLGAATMLSAAGRDGRVTVSLDGNWEIQDSVASTEIPKEFAHRVPVPGLANLAQPAFAGVDLFDSRELIDNRIRKGALPESARTSAVGVARQERNYFWYRTRFRTPARKAVALLKVNKAQFGTAVWLNGKPAGEHFGCFTTGTFDLSRFINWNGDNELLVRVGAHPAAMPVSVPAGTDFEKLKWTPGIYDSVALLLSDAPVIESVQVAPRIASSEALIETRIRNYGAVPVSLSLDHRVKAWKTGAVAASGKPQKLTLRPGEERVVTQTIAIPRAQLWTPEDPFLYVVETSTGGDSASTRFGMRELRFDTATRRAYLNGKLYFLRGSNITFHRFLEDPLAGSLPWNEAWVRKLLVDIPKKMHWNTFRFCIGPVPQRWLDIADEAGLLIQYEYFIWTGGSQFHKEWTTPALTAELSEWVRDNWNHPSVAIWDACNETVADVLRTDVIPAVRKLDLSDRAWDNGYNLPDGPNDIYEDHPYLFSGLGKSFQIPNLEKLEHHKQGAAPHPSAHASILNEYGWIWLNRDGSPTLLTKDVYDRLIGPDATGAERLKEWAYYLGGLTEFWRSKRYHAGILHFVYLTCSYPGVYTSDHWRDVEKLELDPDFADYVGEAFRPLGVYVNLWQPSLKSGETRRLPVSLINDEAEPAKGKLLLTLESGGKEIVRREADFFVAAHGQHTIPFDITLPQVTGEYLLKASAVHGNDRTISRRKFRVTAP